MIDKEFVSKMKEISPQLTHEQAMLIYGLVAEEKMAADREGYIRCERDRAKDKTKLTLPRWLAGSEFRWKCVCGTVCNGLPNCRMCNSAPPPLKG